MQGLPPITSGSCVIRSNVAKAFSSIKTHCKGNEVRKIFQEVFLSIIRRHQSVFLRHLFNFTQRCARRNLEGSKIGLTNPSSTALSQPPTIGALWSSRPNCLPLSSRANRHRTRKGFEKEKFRRLDQGKVKELLSRLRAEAKWVSPKVRLHVARAGPEDNKFPACAVRDSQSQSGAVLEGCRQGACPAILIRVQPERTPPPEFPPEILALR
jgi:hypothetical protein